MLRVTNADPNSGEYYLAFFRPLRGDLVSCAVYTHFIDWSPRNDRWEIRQASKIDYGWLRRLVQRYGAGEARRPVRDRDALDEVIRDVNGAAISSEMMRRYLPDLLKPTECVRDLDTFVPTFDPSDELVNRTVPTRRLRGTVLNRDGRRCAVCGRSPRNHLDLELELHHVLPVRKHGPTVAENLLTLCGACHDGLNPDHDPSLRAVGQLAGPIERAGMDITGITDNLVDGIIVDRGAVRRPIPAKPLSPIDGPTAASRSTTAPTPTQKVARPAQDRRAGKRHPQG